MMKTSKQKMLDYLTRDSKYNTFTVAQARNLFGVKNVAARINELRQEGYPIYTNTKTLKDGRQITFYRMGTPSRKLIAAGFQFLKMQGDRAFA